MRRFSVWFGWNWFGLINLVISALNAYITHYKINFEFVESKSNLHAENIKNINVRTVPTTVEANSFYVCIIFAL